MPRPLAVEDAAPQSDLWQTPTAAAARPHYAGHRERLRDRAERDAAYYRDAYQASNTFVARSTVNIRSQPTTKATRVGTLRGGETFQSLGATRDGSDGQFRLKLEMEF